MIKKFIVLFFFSVSAATVQAKVDGDEALAIGIIGFILGKMYQKNKDKKDDNIVWENNDKVILKHVNNQLILGNVVLKPNGLPDSVSFPQCKVSKNDPVRALRFRIDQADVYVRSVQITYQNGQRENVAVDRTFGKKSSSSWYNIDGQQRCIQKIRVSGESLSNGKTWQTRNALLTFIGYK